MKIRIDNYPNFVFYVVYYSYIFLINDTFTKKYKQIYFINNNNRKIY